MFSFGGGTSKSKSESSSSSFDNLDQVGFGFDVSTNRSESGGASRSLDRSGSESTTRSRVAFEDVFADLFGNAAGAAGRVATGNITNAANLLFNAGGSIIDNLQDGGVAQSTLEERLAARDGLADQQVDQLGDDLARFLAEDANPAITQSGVAANTLGGSRGEVQRGIATRGASEAFVRGATDIRLADQSARDNIATTLLANENARSATSLSALPSLFGLQEAGALAELSPLQQLAGILGPQTVLQDSDATSFGFGESSSEQFSSAIAEALGLSFDRTTGRAGSESSSSSSSSSKSLSLGFSDRRLKRDIRRVGTVNGHAWYEFEFLWGERGEGVMADEVPAEFVETHASGFAMVDYGKLLAA